MRKIYLKTAPFCGRLGVSHTAEGIFFPSLEVETKLRIFLQLADTRMYNLERYRSQRCKTRLYTIPSFYDNCSFLTSIYLYLFKIFQFFFFFKSISINYLRSKYSTNTEYRREKKKYFIGSRKKKWYINHLIVVNIKENNNIGWRTKERRCCTREGYFETLVYYI